MKSTIGHIILNVSDFSASEKFYDAIMSVMGFEGGHKDTGDAGTIKLYTQGEHNLWIRWDKEHVHEKFVRDVGLDHLAFMVEMDADVDKLHQIVQLQGTLITRLPRKYPEYSSTYYAFYFRDPDGVPLEVYRK